MGIEVSCSEYEGIDAVKESLAKGMEQEKEDCEVKINLVAHPLFVLTCTCRDKPRGFEAMEACMKKIEEAIKAKGGTFQIVSMPQLIGQEQKGDDENESESGSEKGSDDTESEQDETMGQLDEKAVE